MGKKNKSNIDGNHILYHFLQKDLFESDIWLFQMLSARLVSSLGIWLHPDFYQRMPILLPFVIRDPSCRKRKGNEVEAWGSPNVRGHLRDDNSLVKGLPRSLSVASSKQSLYNEKKIGNGFVASHVWRQITGSSFDADLASRDPWLNTFVPNLVWLPSQVSKLSDREGTFTQLYLQALSAKIYRHLPVSESLTPIVDRSWQMVNIPSGIPKQGLPETDELSFFKPTEKFFTTRRRKIEDVIVGIETTLSGKTIEGKVITSRYGDGLSTVPIEQLENRLNELREYLQALEIFK